MKKLMILIDRTTRGFLDGWDPHTGKKLWRRYTIPAPGEPGSETWPKDMPDAWKYGGGVDRQRQEPRERHNVRDGLQSQPV